MSAPNGFAPPTEGFVARLRERPYALAAGALVCGALLGGLAVYQPLGSTKDAPARTAETTGSGSPSVPPATATAVADKAQPAASNETAGAVDCDRQTWPYLSHECAEHKRRSLRVVTTDKLADPVVNAIEAPAPAGNGAAPPAAGTVPAMNPSPERSPVATASAPRPGPRAAPTPATPKPAAPAAVASAPPAPAPVAAPAPVTAPAPAASAAPVAAPTPVVAAPPPAAPKVAATPPRETTPPPKMAATPPRETAPPPPAPAPAATHTAPAAQVVAVEPSASEASLPSPTSSMAGDPSKDAAKRSKRKKAKSRDRSNDVEVENDRAEGTERVRRAEDSERVRESDRSRDSDRRRNREATREADRSRDQDRTRDRGRGEARIVERWIEREYDVPSDSGGRKRVRVIQRDNDRSDRYAEPVERGERRGGFFFGEGFRF